MKVKITSAEHAALPDAVKSEYELKGSDYVLKIEGDVVPRSELDAVNSSLAQFRDTNTILIKDKAALETRLKTYDGIDPAEHAVLKSKVAEFGRRGANDPADMETKIQAAVKAATEPLAAQLTAITTREKQATEALQRRDLEATLTAAGLKAGVDEKALPDFLARGLSVFQIQEGKVVAQKDGAPLYSKSNAGVPLTPEEWAQELPREAAHLFKTSKGGGANPGPGGPGGKRTISGTDPLEFGRNLEDIAKGAVAVAQSQS